VVSIIKFCGIRRSNEFASIMYGRDYFRRISSAGRSGKSLRIGRILRIEINFISSDAVGLLRRISSLSRWKMTKSYLKATVCDTLTRLLVQKQLAYENFVIFSCRVRAPYPAPLFLLLDLICAFFFNSVIRMMIPCFRKLYNKRD
jgi:hypothetical protein